MNKFRRPIAVLLSCILLLLPVPVHAAEYEPIRIAFLDSGISLKHLDPSRVKTGENLVFPWQDTVDRIGHGTATAGIVLGSEELGLPSLCPETVVVPLVCYDCYPSGVTAQGDGETLARAIRLAVDRYDCRIINISMGMTKDDPALQEAVEYALAQGLIIVSAVGNQNETAPERVYYPAAYDGVIGVGAADGEQVADFSQRHSVDVLAQGVGLPTATNRNSAKVQTRSGTSFSCAVVSGLCAAIWATEPELSADEVCERLYSTAKDIGEPGFDTDSGWGIVSTQPGVADDTPETEPEKDPVKDCLKDGTCPASKFTDVKMDWSHDGIHYCVENGLMNGEGNNSFNPNGQSARAMLVTVLYRLEGEPEVGECNYSDVPAGEWYTDAVTWAAEHKIVEGYAGKFDPTGDITREQFATILYRYAKYKGYDVSVGEDTNILSFVDAEEISSWAKDAMQWAVGAGLFEGKGENNLDPTGKATRAEMATILYRFCENV